MKLMKVGIKLDVEQGLATKRYDNDLYHSHYVKHPLFTQFIDLILIPLNLNPETDLERSVSIRTVPNEKSYRRWQTYSHRTLRKVF